MIYQCVNCKSEIENESDLFKECPKCNFINYKINNIPIVVRNLKDYISDKLFSFTLYINNLERTLKTFELIKAPNENIKKTIFIIEKKIELVKKIKKELIPFCDTESLLNKAFSYSEQGYDISYNYLFRDWGNFKDSEEENNVIYQHIKSKINDKNNSKALVLGAGVGRLAVELTKDFENIFAVDLSYEMAAMFDKIKESSIELDLLLLKNSIFETKNYISAKIESSKILEVAGSKERLSNLKYFVSDVRNLPFRNDSMDAIISCYFTDILPIDEYFHEIDRVLKEGGFFIHFGPLDYHFANQSKMLSLTDLTNLFRQRGYEVEVFEPVLLEHISLPVRGLKKIYNNWFFKACKKKKIHERIDFNSVLKINGLINYEIIGSLQDNLNAAKQKVRIHTPLNTVYECYIDTIKLLEKFDGEKPLSDIFKSIENDFVITEKVKEVILKVIMELIKNQLLVIVKQGVP